MGRVVTLSEATSLMTLVDRVKEHVKMPRGKTLPCGAFGSGLIV